MTFILDENISWRIILQLNGSLRNCLHVRKLAPPLKTDMEIWNYALKYKNSIITFDVDYYHIQVLNGFPPKIIWLRCGNTTTKNLARKLNDHEEDIIEFLKNSDAGIIEIY